MGYILKNNPESKSSNMIDIAMTNILLLKKNSEDLSLSKSERLEAQLFVDEIKKQLATI